jgi:hypothetical protein
MLPAVNARIRNSLSRNVESVTLVSMAAKIASTTTPTASSMRTLGLDQPIAKDPAGSMP